jgi:hypothetical protein
MLPRQFQCGNCGSSEGYRSRPRGFSEKYLLRLLFLRPVRCADCFRRSYCPVFVQVRERSGDTFAHRAAA